MKKVCFRSFGYDTIRYCERYDFYELRRCRDGLEIALPASKYDTLMEVVPDDEPY
jgi:hypothetical protein